MRTKLRKTVIAATIVVGVTAGMSTAFAGTGVGGVFNLGATNTVNAPTTLTGSTAGKQLQVTNTNTGSAATGIGITVASGKPPLTVNSKTLVPNLNAGLLGGKSASGFVQGTGNVMQTGLVVVGPNSQVFLGTVPNIGGLWGNCQNVNATTTEMQLDTNNALGNFLFASPHAIYPTSGGGTFTILDSNGVDTAQITTAVGDVATITVSASTVPGNGDCDFSAQFVYSHK